MTNDEHASNRAKATQILLESGMDERFNEIENAFRASAPDPKTGKKPTHRTGLSINYDDGNDVGGYRSPEPHEVPKIGSVMWKKIGVGIIASVAVIVLLIMLGQ
jgi:hypothetical protein